MVEGGTSIHPFPHRRPGRRIHLAVAPFFVGDADAPRFVLPGNFPHGNSRRMSLLLCYLPTKPAAAAN